GLHDLLDDGLDGHGDGAGQPAIAAMGAIVGKRERIGDAATREGQALLALQVRNFFRQAEAKGMVGDGAEAGVEQMLDVRGLDRAEGDAAGLGLDLEQRLQPEQAARAVADQRDFDAAGVGGAAHGLRHFMGTDGEGGGIARHEDAHAHRPSSPSAISRSKAAASTRPWSLPSSMSAGEQAQSPRQNTGSRVKRPSAEVSWKSMPRRPLICSASRSLPMLWQASARQTRTTWWPGGAWRKSW